ncbi:hypothetical protein TSUD_139180 [Trifolium subterraneum]|uniref:Zinc finger C2H2 LYAR-type domain-containing protein n=1 Tax=Trifolium subterraneum TaxID=3900 RepID=A0A2Z6P0F7_TRISU|nr:hypothetical protein TSUD_139180 [Trifolium subterraneum]
MQLSCIDCGQMFGQDTVLNHCITEAKKYGPQGQGKTLNAAASKPVKEGKQRSVVDTNVGLSQRPLWFCRLGILV